MTGSGCRLSLLMLALALAGCNQTGGEPARMAANVAYRVDPTGLSGSAIDLADSLRPPSDPGESGAPDLSMFAPRLRDVAAGNTARPNMMASVDNTMNTMMALQTMGLASSVVGAAVSGAMSGGTSLISAAPGLVMQAAMTGAMTSQMTAAREQTKVALIQAEAERAADRVVPDEDRPAEAQAILSLLDGAGGRSATWQNPQTGASGRVTVQAVHKKNIPDTLTCRLVKQEWRSGKQTRTGNMAVCASNGEWYDLS